MKVNGMRTLARKIFKTLHKINPNFMNDIFR